MDLILAYVSFFILANVGFMMTWQFWFIMGLGLVMKAIDMEMDRRRFADW